MGLFFFRVRNSIQTGTEYAFSWTLKLLKTRLWQFLRSNDIVFVRFQLKLLQHELGCKNVLLGVRKKMQLEASHLLILYISIDNSYKLIHLISFRSKNLHVLITPRKIRCLLDKIIVFTLFGFVKVPSNVSDGDCKPFQGVHMNQKYTKRKRTSRIKGYLFFFYSFRNPFFA